MMIRPDAAVVKAERDFRACPWWRYRKSERLWQAYRAALVEYVDSLAPGTMTLGNRWARSRKDPPPKARPQVPKVTG